MENMRLNARGFKAGRKENELEQGFPVLKLLEDKKWQLGNYYETEKGFEFLWSHSEHYTKWQDAFKADFLKFHFNFQGRFQWPWIQDEDGLFYTFAEMENVYNWTV